MGIDMRKIRKFWDNRADNYDCRKSYSITNLEENKELEEFKVKREQEKINNVTELSTNDRLLDLGCGIGAWSFFFAKKCKEVVAVDYSSKMLDIAKKIVRQKRIKNINFICKNVIDFESNEKFEYIFISGVLLYIPDSRMPMLLNHITNYSKEGTHLLLRESTGIRGRYEIVDKYSKALKISYSALYRTKSEYVKLFKSIGFFLIHDEDMFEAGCPLNKWSETRLRIYLFKKEGRNKYV